MTDGLQTKPVYAWALDIDSTSNDNYPAGQKYNKETCTLANMIIPKWPNIS